MAKKKPTKEDPTIATWWGFFIFDLEKKSHLSEETKNILLKYAHLFFLIFSSLDASFKLNAQQTDQFDDKKRRKLP